MSIENFHVGQWVIVTRILYEEVEEPVGMFGMDRVVERPLVERTLPVDGTPYQIVAISVPFVLLADQTGTQRAVIDTRGVELSVCHRKYVREMAAFKRERLRVDSGPQDSPPGWLKTMTCQVVDLDELQTKEKTVGFCPMCGERLVQRLDKEKREWFYLCKQCGFNGGPPKDRGRVG